MATPFLTAFTQVKGMFQPGFMSPSAPEYAADYDGGEELGKAEMRRGWWSRCLPYIPSGGGPDNVVRRKT
jgi:hypothetical protein